MWTNLLIWKLIRVGLNCALYYMSRILWDGENIFFGFNTPFNRIASPWTSIVECACSIELVLIFQKALKSNIVTSRQLSQRRDTGSHPGTLYQPQEKRALPYNSFVVQTLISTAGKGKAGICNLRHPRQLWQALSRNPPAAPKWVGVRHAFWAFRLFSFILSVKHLQRH